MFVSLEDLPQDVFTQIGVVITNYLVQYAPGGEGGVPEDRILTPDWVVANIELVMEVAGFHVQLDELPDVTYAPKTQGKYDFHCRGNRDVARQIEHVKSQKFEKLLEFLQVECGKTYEQAEDLGISIAEIYD